VAATYRYLAFDLRTTTFLGELPLYGVKYGQRLSRTGDWSARLRLGQSGQAVLGTTRTLDSDYLAATIPTRTLVIVERNGVPITGGPIWTRRYNGDNRELELAGTDLWGYFAHRRIRQTLTYAAADQTSVIVPGIISYAQGRTGGNVNLTVAGTASGVVRDRTYNYFELKPVAEAVEQMAADIAGFEFAVDWAYTGIAPNMTPTPTLTLSYPQRGRGIDSTGHVFEQGRNLVTYIWPEDGTATTNAYTAIGAGEGASMLRSDAERTDLLDQGFPLLDAGGAYKDVAVQTTLDRLATGWVANFGDLVTVPEVTVRGDMDPVIGAWIVGDYAKFRIGTDVRFPDPRFPGGVEFYRRIVGYDCTPGDTGDELVTLILQ
jgi:hypothetical protein